MKCVVCKLGETEPGVTTVTLERGGSTLVIKDVPAGICGNCGEAYVGEEVGRRLLEEAEAAERSGVEIEVRHFQAA